MARRTHRGFLGMIAMASLLAIAGPALAARCHVNSGAPASHSGTTWATATTLQTALATPACTEIWVAAGVYKPSVRYSHSQTGPRTVTFNIHPGTKVYGGFAGWETQLSQRDPAIHRTILSGDIDNNDVNDDHNNIAETTADIRGANANHVVTMDGTTGTPLLEDTVLDGGVITAGAAFYPGGGGLLCNASSEATARCQPTLNHLLFSGNLASDQPGGALLNWAIYGGKASPTIRNTTFRGNRASNGKGGAIYNEGYGGRASPMLVNVTFVGNRAVDGGAVYASGYAGISNPTFINVTFTDNTADDCGGAVFSSANYHGISAPLFVNVILWGNHAATSNDAGFCADAGTGTNHGVVRAYFEYSIVRGSGGSDAGWALDPNADGGGNIDADPLLGELAWQGGFVPTIAFGPGSPALDAGENALCPLADARGVSRDYGAHCDLGAYESSDFIFADDFGPH